MADERYFFHPAPKQFEPFDVSGSFLFTSAEESEHYFQESVRMVEETPVNVENNGEDVPFDIVDARGEKIRFRIRTFKTGEPREPVEGHLRQKILILSPHCDDEVIGTGVLATVAALQGDHVRALQFTCGSGGRADHGYDEDMTRIVRLRESIESARYIGIESIDVLIGPDGKLGLPEWFWHHSALLPQIGVAVGRIYDSDSIVSPHSNARVDSHPDHHAASVVADFASGWGRNRAFHPTHAPLHYRPRDNAVTTMKYAVWPGESNPRPNFGIPYEPFTGPLARIVAKAISFHRTQSVQNGLYPALEAACVQDPRLATLATLFSNNYALFKFLKESSYGVATDVNNPSFRAVEMYETAGPMPDIHVSEEVLRRAAQVLTV
ncbi:PIG-L family deacetylase [Candidatus Roizmanbacteria bacterium]|nr:PIG-L family deacetylase [Candidatus Roizmanbacteria bacterium]